MIAPAKLVLNAAQKNAFIRIFKNPVPSVDDICTVVSQFTYFSGRRKTVSEIRNNLKPDIIAKCYATVREEWARGRLW